MGQMFLGIQRIFLGGLSIIALGMAVSCARHAQELGSAPAETSNEILIGEVGSLTGNEASFGISTQRGIDIALEEVNAQGGVQGRNLRVLVLDDQGKPEEAAAAVTKLIVQNKVTAILGEVASSRSLAMAPIAQSYRVPMITPASTNPRVTQVGDFVFRICFIDPLQGSVMANFAYQSLKVKRAAILRDIKNDYSMGLAKAFIERFTALGGEIVVDQSYSSGDVDFKSQLTSIRSAKPEAVFVPGYYTEVGLIARQVREIGLQVPLLGGDGWDSSKLVEIGGPALNGNYFSNHYASDDPRPELQTFIKKYKERHQEVPDSMAVLGYDALKLLVDAMKRAKSLSGDDLRAAISGTKNFQGVTGTITLNEQRDAVKPVVVLYIDQGQYVFKDMVSPNG